MAITGALHLRTHHALHTSSLFQALMLSLRHAGPRPPLPILPIQSESGLARPSGPGITNAKFTSPAPFKPVRSLSAHPSLPSAVNMQLTVNHWRFPMEASSVRRSVFPARPPPVLLSFYNSALSKLPDNTQRACGVQAPRSLRETVSTTFTELAPAL